MEFIASFLSVHVGALVCCRPIFAKPMRGPRRYIATAVVSASEACAYVANLFPPGELNLSISTIALLYLCALLNFWGIRESAKIALVIFTVSAPAPLPAPPAVPRRACTIHRCIHRPSRHALPSGAHRHDRCAHRCFGMVLLRAPRGAVLYDMTFHVLRTPLLGRRVSCAASVTRAARDLLAFAFSRPAGLRFVFCFTLLGIYRVFKANWNAPPRLDWPGRSSMASQ